MDAISSNSLQRPQNLQIAELFSVWSAGKVAPPYARIDMSRVVIIEALQAPLLALRFYRGGRPGSSSRSDLLSAAIGYSLGALQVVTPFGRDTNSLETRGSNLSFYLALAIGLLSLVGLEQQDV